MTRPLPLPLPGDVDVSDMPHMPLFDGRLLKSRAWLRARHWRGSAGPGLAFVLVNLWAAAFRSVPAGSLEDDDDLLADAARCDIEFWRAIRAEALQGWKAMDGRLWHPVVAEIAWGLWQARLRARHEKAHDSYRAACKRASDKGTEPPLPIGSLLEWIAAAFPATDRYMQALAESGGQMEKSGDAGGKSADKSENPSDFRPKRREGKDIPPHSPPSPQAGRNGTADANARKAWFATELGRLKRQFGDRLAGTMAMYLQRPRQNGRAAVSGDFGLVETFKGSWVTRGADGVTEIVMPSKQRADATWAAHHEWLVTIQPKLRLRHATVEEKRTVGVVAA